MCHRRAPPQIVPLVVVAFVVTAACRHQPPGSAIVVMGPPELGGFKVDVPEATVRALVPEIALEDCVASFDLGWHGCSTVLDSCSTLVLLRGSPPHLLFTPQRCGQQLEGDYWLVFSPLTEKVTMIPFRTPDDPPPTITPRP